MNSKFKRILYGGDYNPNQWPKDIWKKDMEYFKDARINSATMKTSMPACLPLPRIPLARAAPITSVPIWARRASIRC